MASEPAWIREDVVRAIHRRQLAEHGGEDGVRDLGMLQSALARPRNPLAYSATRLDLARLAAAYAFGIVRNHPFVDGNKRTAYVVCRTFLLLNGCDLTAPQREKYDVLLRLASGKLSEEGLTAKLREWLTVAP